VSKSNQEEATDMQADVDTGSVYFQLGLKNYEEMETKASLVMEISKAIRKRKLTQTAAAELFNISQPKLSELLKGHFRGYSVERLIHFLVQLEQDVDIVIKSKPRNRKARVSVYHSINESHAKAPMAAKGCC